MSLKKKLKYLDSRIKKNWEKIDSTDGMSTRSKLEKLVSMNLKMKKEPVAKHEKGMEVPQDQPFIIRDYVYSPDAFFGSVQLSQWRSVSPELLSVMVQDESFQNVDPARMVFVDTETTGLSGGTGTIPFMVGLGYFEGEQFLVRIFILNDLYQEELFLEEIEAFLAEKEFQASVTYNGRSFDFPLLETRFILHRKRFPLSKIPHLDFLFPARILWKNTYESRRLGFLGETLLGISRDDDIDGSLIPGIYFNYLRSQNYSLLAQVVEHNAMDIVGLSALLLLGLKYLQDISHTADEGEVLGTAMIYERYGDIRKADELYTVVKETATRSEVLSVSVKRQSILKKKEKLYQDATELWEILAKFDDPMACRELSIQYEHREKNLYKAMETVQRGIDTLDLSATQKTDLEKRLVRIRGKIEKLEMTNSVKKK